jgi:hypothetical protein
MRNSCGTSPVPYFIRRGLVGSNAHPATQLIDFLAILFGYAISGERTLEAFYERLQPFAVLV